MSTLKADTIQTTSGADKATIHAHCTWNNTGTIAIRSDAGISSLTDQGSGQTQLNLDNSVSAAEKLACTNSAFGGYTNNAPDNYDINQAGNRTTGVIAASSFAGGFTDRLYNSIIAAGQ